jgi:hypothetical protein
LLPNISEKARYYSLPFGGGGFQTRLYQEFEAALKIYFQGSSSWAFGPPVKHEKLYAPSPPLEEME